MKHRQRAVFSDTPVDQYTSKKEDTLSRRIHDPVDGHVQRPSSLLVAIMPCQERRSVLSLLFCFFSLSCGDVKILKHV